MVWKGGEIGWEGGIVEGGGVKVRLNQLGQTWTRLLSMIFLKTNRLEVKI